MPIVSKCIKVIHEGKRPAEAVRDLMQRFSQTRALLN